MKQVFFLILAVFFALALSACGPSESVKQEQPKEEQQQEEQKPAEEEKQVQETPAEVQEEPVSVVKNLEDEKPALMQVARIEKKEVSAQKILFRKVFFPFFTDRGEVPYRIKAALEKIIPDLKKQTAKNPKALIVVKGYTTKAGAVKQNKPLSLWRASEAAAYLSWKSGIPLNRFRFQGLGEMKKNQPSARRVEILVIQP